MCSRFTYVCILIHACQLFTLVNESHAAMYQAQIAEEIEPQILELTERAEKGIRNLERKETVLSSKVRSSSAQGSHTLTIITSWRPLKVAPPVALLLGPPPL